ncbi:putative fatty acyl-CoA reductase CG5065 [Planococcus citri]|uniref:putative fatty acyl-CoA reductase CG5065 n=1 Tax=Planococcus citri TaxID=170843 RepID=UPI0031F91084
MSSDDDIDNLPDRISDTFIGRTVFMTGGSGFLGRVLMEKILRKCPQVKTIYLLLRMKKGKSSHQRIHELFNSPLFDLLKQTHGADIIKKVIVIPGDVMLPNLGISEEDSKLLHENVEIFYHCAATIRFDEPLKSAVLLNTRGTRYALEFAKKIKTLEYFLYVSTAYCHLNEKVLHEEAYPPPADPHKIIRAMEILDNDLVELISKKVLGTFPNTYAYTKCLSEHLVVEQIRAGFPASIARPSVVIPVWLEPLPGWTDNINGPTGLLIGAGKGVIRTMYCNNEGYADYLPVDIAVNGLIIGTWNYVDNKDRTRNIFHLTSSQEWQVSWQEVIDIGKSIVTNELPLNGVVWYPGGSMKKNKLLHQICVILFHMIPAYVLDFFIFCSGNKPVLCRVQDKINKGFEVFEYYANNQWEFRNEHVHYIRKVMNKRERRDYKIDGEDMDIREYFKSCVMAARNYILKEPPETIPAARRHMKVMYCLDILVKTLFFGWLIWLVVGFLNNAVNYMFDLNTTA